MRRSWLAGVLGLAVLATSCTTTTSGHPDTQAVPIRVTSTAKLTGNELKYGASPAPGGGIVLQPGVVTIGGGADSIVSAGGDGLNWTIKASAPGADQLAVGKIMMATSYATGRVLALTRDGGAVRVLLGPIELTDLIKDADIGTGTAVPLTGGLAVSTPTLPVFDASTATGSAGHKFLGPRHSFFSVNPAGGTAAVPTPVAPTVPSLPNLPSIPTAVPTEASVPPQNVNLPTPSYTAPTVQVGPFALQAYTANASAGVHLGYSSGAGRLQATLELGLDKPQFAFHLGITNGHLLDASLNLAAGGYIRYAFSAATTNSSGDFKIPTMVVPVALTFPLGPLPVPLTLSFTQSFDVSMQLAGEAALTGSGSYKLNGRIGFGFHNGSLGLDALTGSTQKPVTRSVTSLSVGINAIKFGYGVKAGVGIGIPMLSAGVWYQIASQLEVVADGGPTPLSLKAGCVKAALEITGNYGVGYTIPAVVAHVINLFLSLLNVKPISASGGPSGAHTIWKPDPAQYCLKRSN
jgi:hypothetical protein